jgi:hypothetical protein
MMPGSQNCGVKAAPQRHLLFDSGSINTFLQQQIYPAIEELLEVVFCMEDQWDQSSMP